MPQQQQPEPDQLSDDFRGAVNLVYIVAHAHAMCITMFIRHSFGTNVPGLSGVFAVFLMMLAVAQTNDSRMLSFLSAWIVALIFQRLRTGYLFLRGRREHSAYSGWPWLAMWMPFVKTETQAKNFEPALCGLIGWFLCLYSESVGGFVMLGFVSLLAVRVMHLQAVRRQVTAMRDMAIEQGQLSERIRGVRNDF